MPNKPDELEQILQSYKGDTQAVDEDAVLRQYPEKLNQAHDDNLQEAKQAIQAHIDKKMNKLLDRVESKATEYYDWSKSLEKEVERPFMAVPLERIKQLRSEL